MWGGPRDWSRLGLLAPLPLILSGIRPPPAAGPRDFTEKTVFVKQTPEDLGESARFYFGFASRLLWGFGGAPVAATPAMAQVRLERAAGDKPGPR